ncbi:hypothetical protein [Spirillospora sp. NPDC047279]|uniref:hypothetical protein n=1 Tax=Spirillospora sp. NPDC047279 TaxID=3155478 RepID=UPI0033CF3C69
MSSADPLLQPTVRDPRAGRAPWRLSSQGYVAFLGGVTAGTVIGFLNARRLDVPASRRWAILGAGAVAWAATVWIILDLIGPDGTSTAVRMAARVCAVLAYLLQAYLQGPWDRAFQLRNVEHASLWGPGAIAVVGCGTVEALVLARLVAG